ncbi:MAG: hypothetical protein KGD74_05875 [Candidatus Lokiarchaeota archaeon]|nr:hypothetical protein [Candidatus Lokiarchaeota archaeon]
MNRNEEMEKKIKILSRIIVSGNDLNVLSSYFWNLINSFRDNETKTIMLDKLSKSTWFQKIENNGYYGIIENDWWESLILECISHSDSEIRQAGWNAIQAQITQAEYLYYEDEGHKFPKLPFSFFDHFNNTLINGEDMDTLNIVKILNRNPRFIDLDKIYKEEEYKYLDLKRILVEKIGQKISLNRNQVIKLLTHGSKEVRQASLPMGLNRIKKNPTIDQETGKAILDVINKSEIDKNLHKLIENCVTQLLSSVGDERIILFGLQDEELRYRAIEIYLSDCEINIKILAELVSDKNEKIANLASKAFSKMQKNI